MTAPKRRTVTPPLVDTQAGPDITGGQWVIDPEWGFVTVDQAGESLAGAIAEFMLAKEAAGRSPQTLNYYAQTLGTFAQWADGEGVTTITELTPRHVRRYLVHLQERGHTEGGRLTQYRGPRAFLKWYRAERNLVTWDPLRNVEAPKGNTEPLDPLPLESFGALLTTCEAGTFHGDRDRALLLMLLDSGIRWEECANLLVGNVNMITGAVTILKGKGGKRRTVFVGEETRRALAVYLAHRGTVGAGDALWVKDNGGRLTKGGVREVKRRAAVGAGLSEPGMHAFRRAFAVNALRAGMSMAHLQRLLGHADLSLILRYANLVDDDLADAHRRFGIVDTLNMGTPPKEKT